MRPGVKIAVLLVFDSLTLLYSETMISLLTLCKYRFMTAGSMTIGQIHLRSGVKIAALLVLVFDFLTSLYSDTMISLYNSAKCSS